MKLRKATEEDLEKLWNEVKSVNQFYDELKKMPYEVTAEVLASFEEYVKTRVDLFEKFFQGIKEVSNINTIESLKNEYIGTQTDFDGNDKAESFYAEIEDFKLDSDDSIIVTLKDINGDCFDVNWDKIKNKTAVDVDEYIEERNSADSELETNL